MVKWLSFAAVIVVVDQATKNLVVATMELGERIQVLPFFAWVRWHNEGAAFSLFADAGGLQRWLFVALAVGFTGYLIYEMTRVRDDERIMGWVYAAIMGGAIGNMIDRAGNGYVVDFVLVHYEHHIFPAFNVADSALFCGAAVWILMMILEARRVRASNDAA